MLTENDTVSGRVGALVAEACVELFGAYGVLLSPVEAGLDEGDENVMSGVMGFVGTRLRGTCLLSSAKSTLDASCPAGNRARDWIGELTNQLVGRLKTKLIARGVPREFIIIAIEKHAALSDAFDAIMRERSR